MNSDDLSSWLKVAAENKITTKNTWRSTLIEHFTDINKFKEIQGINFQKASCTLDGCVKVYSTRVDDVSEEATKLLEGFGTEDTVKKKSQKKKGAKTIEKNLANINLKMNNQSIFRDSKFLSLSKKPDGSLLMTELDVSLDGIYRISSAEAKRDVLMCDLKLDSIDFGERLICPSISNYSEIKEIPVQLENDVAGEDIALEEDLNEYVFDEAMDNLNDLELEFTGNQTPVYRESPFSYFKGWAGPSHWKIRSKKNNLDSSQRTREKFYIDFTERVNLDDILETANTLFDAGVIQRRKDVKNNLPEDYNYESEDLYKFNILDRYFNRSSQQPVHDVSITQEQNFAIVEEPVDEIVMDIPTKIDKSEKLLTFRKEQKKVDIKVLKAKIFEQISDGRNKKLSEVCKDIPHLYDKKEAKDISVHFCIVSLLHLANEKNLELVKENNDILITQI